MKNLREARSEAGFTQKILAESIGISQQSYSDYENERTFPDEITLIKIANALNVSVDYLLGRTDELGAMIPCERALQLTEGEGEMLRLFRLISPSLQEVAIDTLRVWANESRKNALPKNA